MKKVASWGLGIFVLIQLPFAYSVCQTHQLVRYLDNLHLAENPTSLPFQDVRGGIHAHTAAGGHSLGTYPEIIQAAKEAGYRYLFITEHPRSPSLSTLLNDPDLVLIYGAEQRQSLGHGVLQTSDGSLQFLTHFSDRELPREVLDRVNGLELYNVHESVKNQNIWYRAGQFLYHRFLHSERFLFHLWNWDRRPFQLWDQTLERRAFTGVAGNDAHQNLGLILQTAAGQDLFTMLLDPYVENFRFVSTHVILPPGEDVTEENILRALETGSAYVAFEGIADSTGFSFHAEQSGRTFPMGAHVGTDARLVLQSPLRARFHLIRNGELHKQLEGDRVVWNAGDHGIYRLEVYPLDPPSLIEGKPWIISNAIFVDSRTPLESDSH